MLKTASMVLCAGAAIFLFNAGVLAEPYPFLEDSGLILNLKGKVKELHESRYILGDNPADKRLLLDRRYSYNQSGSVTKIETINDDGEYSTLFTIDNKGRQSQKTHVSATQGSRAEEAYIYDAQGRLAKIQTIDYDGQMGEITTFTYDAKGNLREKRQAISAKSPVIFRLSYHYDAKNRCDGEYLDSLKGDPWLSREWSYDASDAMVAEVSHDNAGAITQTTRFSYNPDRSLAQADTHYNFDLPDRKISYHYDAAGNPVEAKRYSLGPQKTGTRETLQEIAVTSYLYYP